MLTLVKNSRLAQVANRVRKTRRKDERQARNAGARPEEELGLRDEVHLPPATPEWREAWRVTEGVLRLMRDECRTRRTPLAIVTLTRGIQVSPDREKKKEFLRQLGAEDLYYPERRLTEFGEREGIPVLNLAPTMAKEVPGSSSRLRSLFMFVPTLRKRNGFLMPDKVPSGPWTLWWSMGARSLPNRS